MQYNISLKEKGIAHTIKFSILIAQTNIFCNNIIALLMYKLIYIINSNSILLQYRKNMYALIINNFFSAPIPIK
jgi:hypothetical protein